MKNNISRLEFFYHHRRLDAFSAIGQHSHHVLPQWSTFIRPIWLDKNKLISSEEDELSSFDKIGLVEKLIEGEEDSEKANQQ